MERQMIADNRKKRSIRRNWDEKSQKRKDIRVKEKICYGWIPESQVKCYVTLMFPDNKEAYQGPKMISSLTGAPRCSPTRQLFPSVAVASE